MILQDLVVRCDTVEECYEFMLAYAAQGLVRDSGSASGEKLRVLMGKAVSALSDLPQLYRTAIDQGEVQPAERHRAFFEVLRRDCASALAAVELVLSQSAISSQLVDNLNASIHLRTLLTDLFLLDDIAKLQQSPNQQPLSADR
jgi:hypothetical protein